MLPVSAEINESDAGQEQKNLRPIATSAMDLVHSLGLIQPSTERLQLRGFNRAGGHPQHQGSGHPVAAARYLWTCRY